MRLNDKYSEKLKKGPIESPKIPHEKLKKGQASKDYPKISDNNNNHHHHDSVKEDYKKNKPNHKSEINDPKETKNKQKTSFHEPLKEELKESKKPPIYHEELLRSERTFADPLQQELQIRNSNREISNRNSMDESQRPKISKQQSILDELQKENIINDNRNNKTKGALILSMILIKRSMRNSTINKKAKAFIKWMKGIMIQERELMNNEFNDLNILLSEMVCRENQRIMGLRLKKNDMDSRINVLNQMLTCLKVNVFQKNIKKMKV